MAALPRAPLAFAALAASALAAGPAAASPSLECTLRGPGVLSCWGGKLTVRTADIWDSDRISTASRVSPGRHDIVVAADRACALTPGGPLACWGDNEFGELGDGTRTKRDKPVRARGLDDVTAVALAPRMSCALRSSGKVACWGSDDVTGKDRLAPASVPSLDSVVELAAGAGHACARKQDSSVWCWGGNHYGQLGDGTQKDRRRPVQVEGLTDVAEISTGLSHTCARRLDGSVWCWGNGWGGEDGAEDRLLVPERVKAIRGATALVSTASGILVLEHGGRVMSCSYHVGEAQSEATATLRCREATAAVLRRNERTPDLSALGGLTITLHRPEPGKRKPR
jgi:Regulator of chromosome condensation (RCC1) repeat